MAITVLFGTKAPAEVKAAKAQLARASALGLGPKHAEKPVNLVLTGGPGIKALNRRFLGKDRLTDVIAFNFPPSPAPGADWGEIYICLPAAARQARALGHSLLTELLVLAVHGALHLAGMDDGTPARRRAMNRKKVVLEGATFARADFSSADVTKANLNHAMFADTLFQKVRLSDARAEQLACERVDFRADLDLEPATGEQMAQALRRRDQAGPAERDVYAAYIHEAFLTLLEQRRPQVVFQFSLGAEPLPYETGSRLASRTVRQLGEMASRHPGLRFQCFLASQAANQSLCTLGRELPNVSLAGYWWHSFFPAIIRQVMAERLDMLPVNKQVGLFSDAYCAEWVYGKAALVRRCLAQVLADRVSQGQYSRRDALGIARAILFDTAQSLLGFTPSPALTR
jgi:rRNA maturation RNase YbeY